MLRFLTLIHQFLAGQMPGVNFWSGQMPGGQIPGPGICLLTMYLDWLHSLIKSKDNYVKVFDTYSPIFGRTNASSQSQEDKYLESILVRTNAWS